MSEIQNDPHMHQEAGKKKKHGIITYPDTIGPYTLCKTIGEGAFSIVKLAYHELYFQYYACKIVPIKMLQEKNLFDRFELEIRVSQLMRHPGVACITDMLKDEHNYYIFMEYYPNGNLLNYIVSKTRLDEDEAKVYIWQIFDALDYIHKLNVSHRDMKPENIMIDNGGHLRISDFGLSRFVADDHLAKTPCGSPCYVSPECISGKNYDGMKSDIWSCGVILYAMVTGMLPWTKRKMHDLFKQIRSGTFSIPHYVSPQCANLIQLLMTVDPDKRITIDEAKHHTWFSSPSSSPSLLTDSSSTTSFTKTPLPRSTQNPILQGVPYLSTRKVDIYFRPDIDYDFDCQFNDISNLHAIDNNNEKQKCDVSSEQLDFDESLKLLKKKNQVSIKTVGFENHDIKENRKRTSSMLRISSLNALSLKNQFNSQEIPMNEIGQQKSESSFHDAHKYSKESGEVVEEEEPNRKIEKKEKKVQLPKLEKSSAEKKNNKSNRNSTDRSIIDMKKSKRKSARLPRRFESFSYQ